MIKFLDDKLTTELSHNLPSQNIRRYPSVLALQHPNGEDLIILKTRYERTPTENLDLSKFELYSVRQNWDHDYSELSARYIILDHKLLNNRVKSILNSL